MKSNIRKFVIWVAVVMAVSFLCAGIVLMITGNFSIAVEQIDETKTFDPEEINKIYIDITSTDINIISSTDEEIKVRFSGEVSTNRNRDIPSLVAYKSGDELRIEIIQPKTIFIGISIWRTKLDVYIPEDSIEVLNMDTTSSDIDIDNLKVSDIDLKSVSGDFKGESIYAENIKFNTTSGDITINDYSGDINIHAVSGDLALEGGSQNENIEVVTTSGDMYIEQEDPSDMNISTISGDVGISLSEDAGFHLKVDTVSGDIENKFPIKITSSGRRSLEGTVGNNGKEIIISTTSGDVDIDY